MRISDKENRMDKNILLIDVNLLDREWVNQPKLYFEYGEKLADSRRRLESLRNRLEIEEDELNAVSAQLDLDIRNHPKKYGISEKVTENVIKAAIPLQKKYQMAKLVCRKTRRRIIRARHTFDVLTSFLFALEQRKSGLEHLVKLHGQMYFSTPRANSDGRDVINDSRKKNARRRVHSTINKK